MTERISRRTILGGLTAASAGVLAGCTGDRLTVASVSGDEFDGTMRIEYGAISAHALVVEFAERPDVNGVALISPDGEQVQARPLSTGERRVSLPSNSLDRGTWTVILVRGGSADCYARTCSVSGGEIVADIKVEIA